MARARSAVAAIVWAGAVVMSWGLAAEAGTQGADWPMGGQNLSNTRHQPAEATLGPGNVPGLKTRWVFTTGGDVSATPAITGGALYVPDWAGNVYRLDATSGAAVWARRLPDLVGSSKAASRTSPAVGGGALYLGTLDGAFLVALSTATGDLLWKTQLDTHRAALITQSPVLHQGLVYVGVSSKEEGLLSLLPGYKCCTFRGSVAAVNAADGHVVWQTYMTPDNGGHGGGYSGGSVWGSTPVVDAARGSLYIPTGNNYSVPPDVEACEKAREQDPSLPTCIVPSNHVDAVVALDLQTGAVKWSTKVQGYDAWNFACLTKGHPLPNCPDPRGVDYDFGQGPMLFSVPTSSGPRPVLAIGQKSGLLWALDPDTGAVLWSTVVGPSGSLGGLQWGSATDGSRIYVAEANSGRRLHTLEPSGVKTRSGSWGALDPLTGTILWQTAVPGKATSALAPVTVANGVLYAGSMARTGDNMYALDAATGAVLWRFASGGSVGGGPAVANGLVYWGSGYSNLGLGTPNNKLYVFDVSH
jgi:polyvinyl alcohol dehydrogenase (cytochrome)